MPLLLLDLMVCLFLLILLNLNAASHIDFEQFLILLLPGDNLGIPFLQLLPAHLNVIRNEFIELQHFPLHVHIDRILLRQITIEPLDLIPI